MYIPDSGRIMHIPVKNISEQRLVYRLEKVKDEEQLVRWKEIYGDLNKQSAATQKRKVKPVKKKNE